MRKLLVFLFVCLCLGLPKALAIEKNLIQECIATSKALSSYHSEMHIRDLTDKRIKGKDVHTIDWIIDYVSPDKFSIEQYANVDKLADKWITIGDVNFRYFDFWVEMPLKDEHEARTFELNRALLLDKYIEILMDSRPTAELEEGEFVILDYQPKTWKGYNKFWELKNTDNCELKIWINKRNKLIKKAFFKIRGKREKGVEVNYEFSQEFSNYNSNIRIEKPSAMNFEKDQAKIIEKIGRLKDEKAGK